jgi:hydroxymethylpyrimidine pyrophosphatase-like HAD family hydrolase
MRYLALALDFDGTLASHGTVSREARDALQLLKASGRKLLLVTGRRLDDLRQVFDGVSLFDAIVAENGALVFSPASGEERTICDPPPPEFAAALQRRKVPFVAGKVIVATDEPHDVTVLKVIRQLGLELEIIYNKGSVMVLPAGVNKATGLAAALEDLGLSAHNVAGAGDAENDHAFLAECEFAAAVKNALPALKERVDFVSRRPNGRGVADVITRLLADDLAALSARSRRHELVLGRKEAGGR